MYGADDETRTHTAFATAPSRRRVYQFHHVGYILRQFMQSAPQTTNHHATQKHPTWEYPGLPDLTLDFPNCSLYPERQSEERLPECSV